MPPFGTTSALLLHNESSSCAQRCSWWGDGLWLSRPTTEGVRDVARGGVHLSPQPLLCCCLQAVHSFSTPLCLSCLPPPLWRNKHTTQRTTEAAAQDGECQSNCAERRWAALLSFPSRRPMERGYEEMCLDSRLLKLARDNVRNSAERTCCFIGIFCA